MFRPGVRTRESSVRQNEIVPNGAGFGADGTERHVRAKPGEVEQMNLVPEDHADEVVCLPGGESVERMPQQGVDAGGFTRRDRARREFRKVGGGRRRPPIRTERVAPFLRDALPDGVYPAPPVPVEQKLARIEKVVLSEERALRAARAFH